MQWRTCQHHPAAPDALMDCLLLYHKPAMQSLGNQGLQAQMPNMGLQLCLVCCNQKRIHADNSLPLHEVCWHPRSPKQDVCGRMRDQKGNGRQRLTAHLPS